MDRRTLLVAATASVGTALPLAGCSDDDAGGRTYVLRMSEAADGAADDPLDLDAAGITPGQQEIVDEAIRTGSYEEADVTWNTLPAQEGITMAFRNLIQLIARHANRDPSVDEPTTIEVTAAYGRSTYEAVVVVTE